MENNLKADLVTVDFDLSFPVHISDEPLEVNLRDTTCTLQFEKVTRETIDPRLRLGGGNFDLIEDRFGWVRYSKVKVSIPLSKLPTVPPGIKRDEWPVEIAISAVNNFLAHYRDLLDASWIRGMNPTEVWASDVTYLEGGVPKRTISHRRLHQLKPPIIGIDAKLERSLRERLGESRHVLPWKLLLLDAEDALSRGDTRLSVILGQTAIEGAISELLIRKLLEKRPPLDEVRDKLRVRTNRDSNRAGNIGRVLKGWVPAGKTTYGYRYQKEIDPSSGAMLRAWWDIDQVDPEGNILYGSEAWVVVRIYHWIGVENQSPHWVAKELNRLGIKPRYADDWSPSLIVFLVRKRCYTGNHAYNTVHYVTNPERPLGDITGEIKRTIRKP